MGTTTIDWTGSSGAVCLTMSPLYLDVTDIFPHQWMVCRSDTQFPESSYNLSNVLYIEIYCFKFHLLSGASSYILMVTFGMF